MDTYPCFHVNSSFFEKDLRTRTAFSEMNTHQAYSYYIFFPQQTRFYIRAFIDEIYI